MATRKTIRYNGPERHLSCQQRRRLEPDPEDAPSKIVASLAARDWRDSAQARVIPICFIAQQMSLRRQSSSLLYWQASYPRNPPCLCCVSTWEHVSFEFRGGVSSCDHAIAFLEDMHRWMEP